MDKAGGAAADPVGIGLGEALDPGDDQAAFGGVIGQVGGLKAALARQAFGLLKGEAVTAHQHLEPSIAPEADHHADPGQVVADLLPHRDAVGPPVLRRWIQQVVVEAVQSADKGVVPSRPLWGEFAKAKIGAAVVANPDKGPLACRGPVAAPPDLIAQLEVTEGNGDFPAQAVDVPLVHRPGHIGQGSAVVEGVLFPIPTLEQVNADLARIEIEGVDVLVGEIAEGFGLAVDRDQPRRARLRGFPLRQGGSDGDEERKETRWKPDRDPAFASPMGALRFGRWRCGGVQMKGPEICNLRRART